MYNVFTAIAACSSCCEDGQSFGALRADAYADDIEKILSCPPKDL